MFNGSFFGEGVNLAQKSLGTSFLRQQVIANNIANVDTPHYKRKTVTFESELNRVLHERDRFPKYALLTKHKKHFQDSFKKEIGQVFPQVIQEHDTHYRNDKNNVDIEKEMSDLVKNSMHYNAVATKISSYLNKLKSVVA